MGAAWSVGREQFKRVSLIACLCDGFSAGVEIADSSWLHKLSVHSQISQH